MAKYSDDQIEDILQNAINERVGIATGDVDGDETLEHVLEYVLKQPDRPVALLDLLEDLREWRTELTIEYFVSEDDGGDSD